MAERYTVRGTVSQSNGRPLAGAIVHVDDWDRNREDHLFTTRTTANGYYDGQFSAEQFRSFTAEVQGPDLIVRAFNAQRLLLATSLSE
ncbi:MAG: carboxypeptidase-like regulatory domain-containing protein [Cyanobacteriota bacterium]